MTSTKPLPPAARLLELEAEAQGLYPDHTFKAVMRLIEDWPTENQIEWLETGVAEFKAGMAA